MDIELPDAQANEVIDLSAGSRHTFILDPFGTASVSGFIESMASYRGHMGLNRFYLDEGANSFKKIKHVVNSDGETVSSPKFMKVYAGAGAPGDSRDMHSVLIDTRGNVYTTGNNDKGQLCLGDYDSRDTFHQVSGLTFRAVAAAVGLDFTLILQADGKVFGCGSNENGELGLGEIVTGTNIPDSRNGLRNITEVATGLSFSLYMSRTGYVYGSGSNLFGQMCETTLGEAVRDPKVRMNRAFTIGVIKMLGVFIFVGLTKSNTSSLSYYQHRNSSSPTLHQSRLDMNHRTSFNGVEKSSPVVVMTKDNSATGHTRIPLNL